MTMVTAGQEIENPLEFIKEHKEDFFHKVGIHAKIGHPVTLEKDVSSYCWLAGQAVYGYSLIFDGFSGRMPNEETEEALESLLKHMTVAHRKSKTTGRDMMEYLDRVLKAYNGLEDAIENAVTHFKESYVGFGHEIAMFARTSELSEEEVEGLYKALPHKMNFYLTTFYGFIGRMPDETSVKLLLDMIGGLLTICRNKPKPTVEEQREALDEILLAHGKLDRHLELEN